MRPADSVPAYRRPLSCKPPDGSSARGPVQSALPGCYPPGQTARTVRSAVGAVHRGACAGRSPLGGSPSSADPGGMASCGRLGNTQMVTAADSLLTGPLTGLLLRS